MIINLENKPHEDGDYEIKEEIVLFRKIMYKGKYYALLLERAISVYKYVLTGCDLNEPPTMQVQLLETIPSCEVLSVENEIEYLKEKYANT